MLTMVTVDPQAEISVTPPNPFLSYFSPCVGPECNPGPGVNPGGGDLFGLNDFGVPIVPIVIGIGVIFVGLVILQSYLAVKAGAGVERVAERWIDKRYGK